MAGSSSIEWTEATWNPIVGCDIVSPGCTNCYAMAMAARIEAMSAGAGKQTHYAGTTKKVKGKAVWTGRLALAPESILTAPLRWKRPRMIFVNSMGDLFHEHVPDEWIDRVFAVMALCPQHTFQVVTKRAARMREYVSGVTDVRRVTLPDGGIYRFGPWAHVDTPLPGAGIGKRWPLPNVWLGVSAERQQEADERIPDLLATPAAIRFVSAEPLLGPIDFTDIPWSADRPRYPETDDISDGRSALHFVEGTRLDWIIVGGESGRDARPMHPDWARAIRDQCASASVPFFFKQWGSWFPNEDCIASETAEDLELRGRYHFFDDCHFIFEGKKAAGRLLDGVEHNGMPEIREVPAL